VIENRRPEQVEYTSDDSKGNRRIYRQHVYELKNERGELIGVVEVTRDITEQRAVERQLYQREKLAALGQLSASIAHEIRNPLAGIRLGIDTMLEDAKEADARFALEAMSDDIRRLNGVLNQLLDFSRRKDSERSHLSIPDVIERAVFFIRQQAKNQKVEITTSFEKNLPEVVADADQLQQVFLNLMLNSIQVMEAGGNISVTAAGMTHEGRPGLQIRMSDTGPGFPEQVKEKLFDMFFSTKPGGSGVGLAIANRIITEHDGAIWIENPEGGGASVTVFLPTGNPNDPK
jgi:two-component system sensor histidine kinase AtoS